MNRVIKFRGKKIVSREWVYGYYVYSNGDLIHEGERGGIWNVDPKTVGQFTGLHDKNGKEIYEGDIVRCNDGSLQEVYFNNCAFVCKSLGTEQTDDDWMIENDDEVIGNIYEERSKK